jgi:hypothetical protein
MQCYKVLQECSTEKPKELIWLKALHSTLATLEQRNTTTQNMK